MCLGLFFSFIWNSVSLVLFTGARYSRLIPRKFNDTMLSYICSLIFPVCGKFCLLSFSSGLKIFYQRSKSAICLVLVVVPVCACKCHAVSGHWGAVTDSLVQTNNQGLCQQVCEPLETLTSKSEWDKSDPVACFWELMSTYLVPSPVCVNKFKWKEQKPCN